MRGVALDGLDEVRHEVVAPVQLDVDLAPGLLDQVALPDEPVVRDDHGDREHHQDRENHPHPRVQRATSETWTNRTPTRPVARREDRIRGPSTRRPVWRRRPPRESASRGSISSGSKGESSQVRDAQPFDPPGRPRSGEEPLHRPRREDVGRELGVGRPDLESPVEVLGLHLQVTTEADRTRRAVQEGLRGHLQRREPGGQLRGPPHRTGAWWSSGPPCCRSSSVS